MVLVAQSKVFELIGKLDETFVFWFSDNAYIDQLKKAKIKNYLICNCTVNHYISRTLSKQDRKTILKYTNAEEKLFTSLIARIYRRNYEDIGMFFFVEAQRMIVPAVTIEQAVDNYFRYLGVKILTMTVQLQLTRNLKVNITNHRRHKWQITEILHKAMIRPISVNKDGIEYDLLVMWAWPIILVKAIISRISHD